MKVRNTRKATRTWIYNFPLNFHLGLRSHSTERSRDDRKMVYPARVFLGLRKHLFSLAKQVQVLDLSSGDSLVCVGEFQY